MITLLRRMTPYLLIFLAMGLVEGGLSVTDADARSRSGGRSFTRSAPVQKSAPAVTQAGQTKPRSGFGSGLAGGLLGGALGGLLFGSMFGMGGGGMGILPILLLGGIGFFFYKRFVKKPVAGGAPGYQPPPSSFGGFGAAQAPVAEPMTGLAAGLAEIQRTDSGFDESYFVEIASDVFFKVQAGWMRRDLSAYSYLLGEELAAQYGQQFEEMRARGEINKLESISVRKVEVLDAGKQAGEDFVTVLFTANLLDYTVNDKTDELISGSMTDPVKFAEEWTWARPEGTDDWKLEGIKVVDN
ncbi:MAG: Tim44 domain-containing protein [Desulfobulbaceae bacterium]|uniref:Tim44 domain-containing protein n=1 Tax=Candidatus Desulfatifera sulfidica TaxID=2841691 RepID=A0A8J6NAW1_9BACT|nr:Tim44 domain-containing protein [Candidatus Desulfatifera sulfidica]